MENEYVGQNRLTTEANSPKLVSRGDVFMPDASPSHVEGEHVTNPVEPTQPVVNASGEEGQSGNQQPPEAAAGNGAANGGNGGERTPTQPTPEGGNGGGNRGRGRGRSRRDEEDSGEDYAKMYSESSENNTKFWDVLHAFEPHVNSHGIPADLLKFIIELQDDDRPLMYMVNKIVTLPLDNETARYSLGLSAQSIKEQITAALKQTLLEATGRGDTVAAERTRERRDRVVATIEAVELLHNMNKAIVTAGIKAFDALAEEITPEQQQVLQNVAGASQVMRLFEDEYQRILMDQKTITTENNDELMSRSGKDLGKHSDKEKDSSEEEDRDKSIGIVEGRLKELRAYAKDKENNVDENSSLGKLSKLEDWELSWAFHSGKLLYNISLRAAEQISMGDVPGGGAALKSPPQENMVRIMNQINWIHKRFAKGEARGGVEFVNRAQAHFQELRERSGFGTTGLKTLAGKSIEDYEVASMFGVSGIFSGWRNEMIILDHSPIKINGEETTILKYIKDVRKAKEDALRGGRTLEEWNKVKDKIMAVNEPDILRTTFLQDGKLRPEFNNALGVLIRFGDIQGKGKDVDIKGLTAIKTDIRSAIWKKIAEDNPLAVAYFLNGMSFEKDAPFSGEKLKDFTAFTDPKNGSLNTEKNPVWKSLREKLIIAREVRMSKIAKGEAMSLEEALVTMVKKGSAEEALLEQIQGYGKDVSKDLAAVRLPFNPFMTDVVFEQAEYAGAGNQYYRRRVGDIGAIHSSYEALNKIVGDPSGLGREETMKALKEMLVAIDAPNGWEAASDSVMPFFMTVLDFWEAGGQYTDQKGDAKGRNFFKRWLAKDNLLRPIAKQFQMSDSLAQKWGGVQAIAYDEFAMRGVINEALAIGITRKAFRKDGVLKMIDTDDWVKKKKGAKFGGILAAFFRDLFLKAFIPAMVIQVGRESKKSDKK